MTQVTGQLHLNKRSRLDHETQLGLFYHDTSRQSLNDMEPVLENGPIAHQPLGISKEQGDAIIQRMM